MLLFLILFYFKKEPNLDFFLINVYAYIFIRMQMRVSEWIFLCSLRLIYASVCCTDSLKLFLMSFFEVAVGKIKSYLLPYHERYNIWKQQKRRLELRTSMDLTKIFWKRDDPRTWTAHVRKLPGSSAPWLIYKPCIVGGEQRAAVMSTASVSGSAHHPCNVDTWIYANITKRERNRRLYVLVCFCHAPLRVRV